MDKEWFFVAIKGDLDTQDLSSIWPTFASIDELLKSIKSVNFFRGVYRFEPIEWEPWSIERAKFHNMHETKWSEGIWEVKDMFYRFTESSKGRGGR